MEEELPELLTPDDISILERGLDWILGGGEGEVNAATDYSQDLHRSDPRVEGDSLGLVALPAHGSAASFDSEVNNGGVVSHSSLQLERGGGGATGVVVHPNMFNNPPSLFDYVQNPLDNWEVLFGIGGGTSADQHLRLPLRIPEQSYQNQAWSNANQADGTCNNLGLVADQYNRRDYSASGFFHTNNGYQSEMLSTNLMSTAGVVAPDVYVTNPTSWPLIGGVSSSNLPTLSPIPMTQWSPAAPDQDLVPKATGEGEPSIKKRRVGRPKGSSSSSSSAKNASQPKCLKAIELNPLSIEVGQWKRISKTGCDLSAKCYFGQRKLVWEFLCDQTKRKQRMELQWTTITKLDTSLHEDQEILRVQLSQPPKFGREIKLPSKRHSSWEGCPDFTSGHALICWTHELVFKTGHLSEKFHKMLEGSSELRRLASSDGPSLHLPTSPRRSVQVQAHCSNGVIRPFGSISDTFQNHQVPCDILNRYNPAIPQLFNDHASRISQPDPSQFELHPGNTVFDASELFGTTSDHTTNQTQNGEDYTWMQYLHQQPHHPPQNPECMDPIPAQHNL